MTFQTEYAFCSFQSSTVTPGRWIVRARMRGEIRLGYIEYSEQFNRFIYVQDNTVVDSRYLAEILDFIKHCECEVNILKNGETQP